MVTICFSSVSVSIGLARLISIMFKYELVYTAIFGCKIKKETNIILVAVYESVAGGHFLLSFFSGHLDLANLPVAIR